MFRLLKRREWGPCRPWFWHGIVKWNAFQTIVSGLHMVCEFIKGIEKWFYQTLSSLQHYKIFKIFPLLNGSKTPTYEKWKVKGKGVGLKNAFACFADITSTFHCVGTHTNSISSRYLFILLDPYSHTWSENLANVLHRTWLGIESRPLDEEYRPLIALPCFVMTHLSHNGLIIQRTMCCLCWLSMQWCGHYDSEDLLWEVNLVITLSHYWYSKYIPHIMSVRISTVQRRKSCILLIFLLLYWAEVYEIWKQSVDQKDFSIVKQW